MSSSLEARISGVGSLLAKLGGIQNVIYPVVREKLELAAIAIHSDAVKSIYAHESSGRTYTRGGVSHTASAPGYPPNSDTGTGARSIMFEVDPDELTAAIGTNLKYMADLELGTQRIEARPWLFPAFEQHRAEILNNVGNAIKEAIQGELA